VDLLWKLEDGSLVQDHPELASPFICWSLDILNAGLAFVDVLGLRDPRLTYAHVRATTDTSGLSPQAAADLLDANLSRNFVAALRDKQWPKMLGAVQLHAPLLYDLVLRMMCQAHVRWTAHELLEHPVFDGECVGGWGEWS
jgi:hypothetical protein